jgi:hypothetical protein
LAKTGIFKWASFNPTAELVIMKHTRLRKRRQITTGHTNLVSIYNDRTLKTDVDQDSNHLKGDEP